MLSEVVRQPGIHMGTTAIYGSFEKQPFDCQPLQFYRYNFSAVRTSNQGSFVDMATKLHTIAVTRRLSQLKKKH